MKIESIQDVNKDADLYLESLTDNYFENTSKRILVKNAYIMGMFAHVKDRDFLLNEICRLKKLNLENMIELKEAQKSRIQMFENYSGYGDDYIGDADRIQKEIDELRKELDSINEIKPDVKDIEGLQKNLKPENHHSKEIQAVSEIPKGTARITVELIKGDPDEIGYCGTYDPTDEFAIRAWSDREHYACWAFDKDDEPLDD